MAYRVTQCSRLRRDRFRFSFFSSSLRSEVELEAQPTVNPEDCVVGRSLLSRSQRKCSHNQGRAKCSIQRVETQASGLTVG
jgi:hypothetical protein